MHMANVTEVRQNASKIIARVLETREPAVVLQRSKPVVYVVEASMYENMLKELDAARNIMRVAESKTALKELSVMRERMSERGKQPDCVPLIRDLREGKR